MSEITLSKGVRQNLLTLQQTADLLSKTQERLATGRKVNSALDNPINFFTSSGLTARANDLSRLLDSVGNAVQTVQAADKGISAITKLIESAQATARQALTSASPAATYALSVAGDAIAADVAGTTESGETLASVTAAATASSAALIELDVDDIAGDYADGDSLTITYGAQTFTFESDEGTDGVAGTNIAFTDAASLRDAINTAFGGAVVASLDGGSPNMLSVRGTDYTTDLSVGAGTIDGDVDVTNATAVLGDTLTITIGATTSTFYYVADIADAADADFAFTDIDDIDDAFTASGIAVAASNSGSGELVLTAADNTTSFTIGGTLGTALTFASATVSPTNATLGALTGDLVINVTGQAAQTITFGGTDVTNRAELLTELGNLTGITATINGDNEIEFTSTDNVSLTLTGDAPVLTALGFDSIDGEAQAATVTVTTPSETRTTAQAAYNELLVQITQLAQDASFNGVNLLNSDNLTVVFNEDGSSTLQIAGVDFTAAGLGLTTQAGDAFQTNVGVNAAIAELDAATATLRAQAAAFGSNLSIVQARQDFTKNMINVLQIGADQLVLADSNEEGANMLALNTRQQLSTVALSLAAQADQNVLRLF